MVIVDPSFKWPPAPEVTTASDGVLSAMFDAQWYGTYLKADFTNTTLFPETPARAYFMRSWDGQAVRGADPAVVVGGFARAYDHEAPLGSVASWFVVPEMADGTLLPPTVMVPKRIADPSGGTAEPSTWVKSLENPNLSVQLMIDSWPTFSYDTNAQSQRIQGRSNPFVTYDVLSGVSSPASFRTMDRNAADALLRLLDSGGTFLFQTAVKYYRPSFYAVVSTVNREDQARYWDTQLKWTLDLIQVDRPATRGSLPSTPGFTFADRKRTYPRFEDIPDRTFEESRPF